MTEIQTPYWLAGLDTLPQGFSATRFLAGFIVGFSYIFYLTRAR